MVVGVEDLEPDLVVDGGVDDLAPAAADFLVALVAVVILPPAADPDVFKTVLLAPEDEYLDGELALTAVVVRLPVAESVADFVDEG